MTEGTQGSYFFLDLVSRTSGPVHVALGGRERCGKDYHVRRSNYPFPTIEFVAEGSGRIGYDGAEPVPIESGSVFGHGPGVNLRMQNAGGQTLVKYFLCLTGRRARETLEEHAPVFGEVATLPHFAEVRELFELLIREGSRSGGHSRQVCEHLARALLLKVGDARRHREGAGTRPSLAREKFIRCKALIDTAGARFASLEDLARALHADASGLSRLFRRYEGVSPYQYLLRHKMNLAAQDLIRTGGFVKEVAARAGYADAYHFSRVFKAVHGIAPAHFPRLARGES